MRRIDAVFTASRNNNLDGVPGPNNDNIGKIRVTYNLFNGGGDLGHLKKTAYQVQEAFETRNKAMIDLKEKIQLDYNSWYASTKRAVVLSDYVVSIKKTRSAYFEQFQIGQRTFLDLLNSQNETYRSKIDYLGSRRDELIARYRILNSLGRLVPFFARQKDDSEHHRNLFSLPKGRSVTNKPSGLKPSGSKPSATIASTLDSQMIYPTGNTNISSATVSVPNDMSQPLPTPNASAVPAAPAAPDLSNPSLAAKNNYLVEINGFKNIKQAESLADRFNKKRLSASVLIKQKSGVSIIYVLVGPFDNLVEANKVLDVVAHTKNIQGIIRSDLTESDPSTTVPN